MKERYPWDARAREEDNVSASEPRHTWGLTVRARVVYGPLMTDKRDTPIDIVEEVPGRWYAEVFATNWQSDTVFFRQKAIRLAREHCRDHGLAISDIRIDPYDN